MVKMMIYILPNIIKILIITGFVINYLLYLLI